MFKLLIATIIVSTGFSVQQHESLSLGYELASVETNAGLSTGTVKQTTHSSVPVDINFPVDDYSQETFTRVRTRSVAVKTSSMNDLPMDNSRSGFNMRCGEWFNTAVEAGWPFNRIQVLLTEIMWNESRCQHYAQSPTNDHGLVQINAHAHRFLLASLGYTTTDLLDPVTNLTVARMVAETAESYSWKWCQPWTYSGSYC